MFENITPQMKTRMDLLESIDAQDRADGTTRMQRLRQIPPETGKFLALQCSNSPSGELVEIGTSAGYSTLWLSLAAKEKQSKIITHELLEEKIVLAKETFSLANIEDYVELVAGDASKTLKDRNDIAFCFLDCEKELYIDCWNIIKEKIVKGGILIADNLLSHQEDLAPFKKLIENDPQFDSVLVPIGKGELLVRKK